MRVGKYVQVKSKSPKCVVLRVEYCVEENRILENTAFEKSTRMTYSQRLPTIQIDTVPSAPPSPEDWSPLEEGDESAEEPVDESDIQLDLEATEQESDTWQEELKLYVEDLLSQAMVVAEKKLQFAGLPEEDEDQQSAAPPSPTQEGEKKNESKPEIDDSEIRAVAQRVVEEVISKATETAQERLASGESEMTFPALPSIEIDSSAVVSAPPSPELEEELPAPKKRWKFTMDDDTDSETILLPEEPTLITFEKAPEDVKEVASNFVKEIVGKAVAMAEEKCIPTVPFNFEDVDLMKTTGPWYIRAREALMRLLRTACFCTPRRRSTLS